MTRRQALLALASSVTWPILAKSGSGQKSIKKGWCGGDSDLHRLFETHWYYTWGPKNRPSSVCEFVPMIKGERGLKQGHALEKMDDISYLLGFNEPEREKQGNVSLEDAVDLWPEIEALAKKQNLRIGSPAPSSDKGGMEWFHSFMDEAKRRDLKVDFVAFHWYRSRDADKFEDQIKDLYREYKLPIWVTEFNGWSGSERENYTFLKEALRFLEKYSKVERYAYFNPKPEKKHSLLNVDGSLTRMGELYRDT